MTLVQKVSTVVATVFIFCIIYFLKTVLTPFFLAALLAYLGDPWVDRLVNVKVPRTLAAGFVFLVILLFIIALAILLIPLVEEQIVLFITQLPKMLTWIQNTAIPWIGEILKVPATVNLQGLSDVIKQHWQQAGNIAIIIWETIMNSGYAIIQFGINLVLVPVVTFYLLRDWNKALAGVQKILPRTIEPTVTLLAKRCDEVIAAFFRGQLLVMLSLGIIYSVGLWIVGLQLALFIGILAGLVCIVPYLGFIVGILAASLAAIFQFHDFIHIVYVFIVFGVAQMVESTLLTPLLVGDKIGLHPVLVIFAVLVGGELFGFLGILLALPVAAIVMVLTRYAKEIYLESNLYTEVAEND